MKLHSHQLVDYLVQQNLLEKTRATTCLEKAEKSQQSFVAVLLQENLLPSLTLARALSEFFHLPFIDLKQIKREEICLDILPEKLMKEQQVVPLVKTGTVLQIAMADPTANDVLTTIKFHSGLTVQVSIADKEELIKLLETLLSKKHYANLTQNSSNDAEDQSIIHLVQQILLDSVRHKASDIHFEPYENFYRVRMRIDGVLHEILQPPLHLANRITTRLKVLAKLDIAERRMPQDGRFAIAADNLSRECRISSCPTLFGEKIVVRILDSDSIALDIHALGFTKEQQNTFLKFIKQPQGMVLVTGPTGSGKTVTLYTGLNILNTLDRNISTVEDPVEINLKGINQVHVNPKIGLTFSTVLRTFLRQDPDVIMVGEIRDLETAEITIRAAQTGHLVLSTLHTNSAAETITRLCNMGIASFNLASAISLIIAQRLVRRLCSHCKKPTATTESEDPQFFNAEGCEECIGGYKGRVGIYEMLPVSEELTALITQNANTFEINHYIKKHAILTLAQSAQQKIKAGITTFAEVDEVLGAL